MAESAFQTKYRTEAIMGFEQNQSFLRMATTTEADVNGNTAVFLVADSGSATATTRGLNGLIPARADSLTQNSLTLTEWHDLVRKTGFNIEMSQGNQRRIMQQTTLGTINRKADAQILAELETGTLDTGAAQTMSLNLVMHALAILGNNSVPLDGDVYAAITPNAHAYLMQTKEFASVDYVANKPFSNAQNAYKWAGVNFIVHPNLTGKQTNAEKCLMWHKSAIGHAHHVEALKVAAGYDAEQDYSYARTSAYMGAKLLQNNGVVVMLHDGSGFPSNA